MKLTPKIGIDNLKFGMTRTECYEIMGNPDRVINDSDEDEIILEFNEPKLRLSFYLNENNRLGYIRTANPKLVFNNQKIINAKIDIVKDEAFGIQIPKWEKEEYDFFTTYFNEENWITLNVEYGEVTEVEIGVPFKNDEEYNWPK